MRDKILKILFLFYHYYDKGSTKSIAYQSSIMALMMIFFLNIYAILVYSSIEGKYLSFAEGVPKWQKYLIIIFVLSPIYFILRKNFGKEEILKIKMDKPTMKKGYLFIISYVTLSIVLLVFVINNK